MIGDTINSELSKRGVELKIGFKRYDVEYHNRLRQVDFLKNEGSVVDGSKWQTYVDHEFLTDDTLKVDIKSACVDGALSSSALFIQLDIHEWVRGENYLLMPAVCYNGNRYESRPQDYMPFFHEFDDLSSAERILLSDVPRLAVDSGVSKLDERTGSFSSPIIAYLNSRNSTSTLLSCDIKENGSDSGICFEESANGDHARLTFTNPVVREVFQYRMTNTKFPSQDVPKNYSKGDRLTFSFRIARKKCHNVGHLYKQVGDYPKWWKGAGNEPINHEMSYSRAFSVIERKFNESNYTEEHGYYAVGLRENAFQDWQLGWTGGLISTLPLFLAGSEESRQRVYRNLEWFFDHAIAPSGLFWGIGENGHTFFGEFERTKPLGKDLLLVRKMADAIYYIIKQFRLFEEAGLEVQRQWKDKLIRAIEIIATVWKTNGQLGHYLNIHTADIVVGGSTSGGLMCASLTLASDYFQEDRYLQIAKEMGTYFYEKYVKKGLIYGGVGDAMHNFDSESCYGLLESFAILSEKLQSKKWIDRTEEVAYLFKTWVSTYNYDFPKDSLFGRLGMQTIGTVFANTQNKHLAPGICTYSGIAFLRHFRHTRDVKWLRILQSITRAIPGYLSSESRPIGSMKSGWISERINTTDWWEPIGEIFEGSTWSETSCMLSRVEIPGIYVVQDIGLVIAFDRVGAQLDKEGNLLIRNDLSYAIEVSIWVENSSNFNHPIQHNMFQMMTHMSLDANATTTLAINELKMEEI